MSHLTLATMARLIDETPGADEAAHLDGCASCRAELEAMREDIRALATLPDMTPAPDAWDALSQRLAAEGIVRSRRSLPLRFRPALQAAAAAVLFVGGLAVGRGLGGAAQVAQLPADPGTPRGENATLAVRETAAEAVAQAERAAPPVTAAAEPGSVVTLASSGAAPRASTPRTMDEAAALLRQTEELYLGALTRYAELATQAEAGDPVARLAALQSIVMTTQAALSQAPADPVINGYHLTALAQRDATLRQVAAATSDRWY